MTELCTFMSVLFHSEAVAHVDLDLTSQVEL